MIDIAYCDGADFYKGVRVKRAGHIFANFGREINRPGGRKDYLLFYRLGDFYEMFFDDAIIASRELELTLTGRDCGEAERAPMCGDRKSVV